MSPQPQTGIKQDRDSQAKTRESQESTAEYSTPRREIMKLTAVFVEIPDGYMGYVEELPGVNTEGTTLDETRENLVDAVQLTLNVNRELTKETISELGLSDYPAHREQLVLAAA